MLAQSRNFRINIVAETSNNIKSLLEEKPMSLTRRRALQALSVLPAAGLIGGLSRPARAAEFSLKYGNNLPLTHPLNIRAQEAADRVARESNGRVEIEIFPNNQLGGDTDMLAQVRSGGIELLHALRAGGRDAGAGRRDQRGRLRLRRLRPGLESDGRRARRACPCRHRQGRPPYVREDVGQRLPPDHQQHQADRERQGHGRPQDPRAGEPAQHLDVQGARSLADQPAVQRGLFGAADQASSTRRKIRCRSSRWRSSTRCRSTARSPTTSGTASGSSPTAAPGTACPPISGHRRQRHQRCRA